MRTYERNNSLLHSPQLMYDILLRGNYDFIYDRMPIRLRRMSALKRWNLLKSGTNLVHRRLNPYNMPLHMQFELTNFCNLNCPVCPTGLGMLNRRPQSMDVELFQRLIDEVGPYLLTASLWGWGEPLLHPQLSDILKAIAKYPVVTFLSTNGQALDDDRVMQAIIDSPPTYLIIAIDGLTDETNTQFRVGAKLAPVLNGVRRIAESKKKRAINLPILHMRYIVMKHNQHELSQLIYFAEQKGFDLLTFRSLCVIDIESADKALQPFTTDIPDYRGYDYEDGLIIKRSDFICQQPFWFPTIFADGTLVACEQDYNAQHSFGVLSPGSSFRALWQGIKARRVREQIRDHSQRLSFCRNCPFIDRQITDASVEAIIYNDEINKLAMYHDGRYRNEAG
jgi:MoaA/NifB/PqqE/SkfB family radical SAM enzyme